MEFYGTLGTACQEVEMIYALFRSGMTGARLNLSHTSLALCEPLLNRFWTAAHRAEVTPRLVIDLQGPEIRIGALDKPVLLSENQTVFLGGINGLPVAQIVIDMAKPDDQIVLDDSAFLLKVLKKEQNALCCQVVRGGILHSRKSLAILNRSIPSPTLTQADWNSLALAVSFGVTHVLQPFVRGRADVEAVREALCKQGASNIRIMAKIENRQGLEHLDEIIEAADEICIARGDLGNAIPLWEIPQIQKEIARRCIKMRRPFCIATQLLWSMQKRAVPTRAEVCDIYNAVLDGADGFMLTGETAIGQYPEKAMYYLTRTAQTAFETQNHHRMED